MMEYKIEWVGSPNFWSGRQDRQPIAIVNHITAGMMPGCLSWMQNPAAKASANYLVTKTGQILQLVKDEDSAWANGAVNKQDWPLYDGTNPNRYTLSIEHEGMPGDGLTDEQYLATLWLHRQLIQKWNIPVDADHIIGHYRIDSINRPNCPGSGFPWPSLYADLSQPVVPDWKRALVERALQRGWLTQDHDPDDAVQLWTILAVLENVMGVK